MSAQEPLTVSPASRTAGRDAMLEPAFDAAAAISAGAAMCASCGQPWFGQVAYCPYCGRASSSALAGAGPGAPDAPHSRAMQAMHGMPRWIGLAAAGVLAVAGIGVMFYADVTRVRPSPFTAASEPAARTPPAAPAPVRAPEAAAVTPRADTAPPPTPQAAVPPARNRALCSVASEAAGLCNSQ